MNRSKPNLPPGAEHAAGPDGQWPLADSAPTPAVEWQPLEASVPTSAALSSYPSVSGQRPIAAPPAAAQETVPLGYVVLAAFFLAIALTGFGVYLALEVL